MYQLSNFSAIEERLLTGTFDSNTMILESCFAQLVHLVPVTYSDYAHPLVYSYQSEERYLGKHPFIGLLRENQHWPLCTAFSFRAFCDSCLVLCMTSPPGCRVDGELSFPTGIHEAVNVTACMRPFDVAIGLPYTLRTGGSVLLIDDGMCNINLLC